MNKRLLVHLALLATCVVSWAQPTLLERYNVTTLDLSAGLPHNNVNHIFVDSQGFVWISTYGGGAVRYDGYSFTTPLLTPPTPPTNTHRHPHPPTLSNSCKGFAEDPYHRLWIAYDEGVYVFDTRTMAPVIPTMAPTAATTAHRDIAHLLRRESVRVYCDSKGALWHVMRDSILRYTFRPDGSVSHISRCPYRGNTPDIQLHDIDHNGTVWVNLNNALCRLCDNGHHLEQRPIAPVLQQLQGHYVTDLLKRDHHVWIATNQGLYAYDLYNATLQHYRHTSDPHSLPHNYATSLALTSDGRLVVGTLRGLSLFHDLSRRFLSWNTSTTHRPMPSDFVHCLLTYGHQLWIGTETAGIIQLSPKPLLIRNYASIHGDPTSLSPHPVNAIHVQPDGTLWVGTVEGGLNRRLSDGTFQHWTTANSGLSHNSVSVLQSDPNGNLWIGTWGGGICRLTMPRPSGNNPNIPANIQHLDVPPHMEPLVSYIGALAYDPQHDALWIGSNDGIFLYNLKTRTLQDPINNNRQVRGCIGALIRHDGQLWMGSLTGLCIIDLRSGPGPDGKYKSRRLRQKLDQPQSPVVDKISCFCETKDGTLWIGSSSYGLYRRVVDEQGKEHFEALTTDDGLVNNAVKGIVEDVQGRLWITTNNGLSIYDPRTRTFKNFGEREGLLCQRFYWNSAVKGPDGAIFLGSIAGLTEVRGENRDADYPVHLTFTRLLVDNQEVTAVDNSILDADISQAERIRLHESNKSFEIHFSTLTYAGEVQGHYSYRLKGFEDDWTVLKPGEHSVRYTTLKPGAYTFEVVCAEDGDSRSHSISIDVVVTPYFWKSWWFIVLVVLLMAAVVVWFYRRRVATLRRQEAEKLLAPIRKAMEDADDPGQLQSRIQTILDSHQYLKKSFRRTVEADKQETQKNNKTLVERATEVLEQNYMNSDFGITEFAEALGMSRSLLSKRLNADTGLSTGQFIRNYRLSVARRLLLENMANRNITEIAYKVGFNDPKYFTRCFTRQYGHSPSTYSGEDE